MHDIIFVNNAMRQAHGFISAINNAEIGRIPGKYGLRPSSKEVKA